MELLDTIDYFYSGLNSSISSFAGIGALKGTHLAAYGLKSVDLTSDTLNFQGFILHIIKNFKMKKNFCKVILDTQNTLIMVDQKSNYKRENQNELIKIHTRITWKNTHSKIKHKTLILEYRHGGLKCADLTFKIIRAQNSCVKRLCDESFLEWKSIPLFYMKKHLVIILNFIPV